MVRIVRHPSGETLSAFADGVPDDGAKAGIKDHLATCSRCRDEVALLRETDDALRSLPGPGLPDGLFAKVLARRDSGIRTILPDTPVRVPGRRRRTPAIAAAAIVAAIAIGIAGPTLRTATAGSSDLRVAPPGSGEAGQRFEYRPGALLDGERTVRVRARVWPVDDPTSPYTVEAGLLEREGETLRGSLELPVDAGYTLIAIEDLAGVALDVNGGDFWADEVSSRSMRSAASARAVIAALDELSAAGLVSPSRVRLATVRATRAHPDNPELWVARATYESRAVTDRAAREAMLSTHGRKLESFASRALADAGNDPERLALLVEYASLLEREDVRGRLLDRLRSVDPGHPLVHELRAIARAAGGSPGAAEALLAELEAGFAASSGTSDFILGMGYQTAREAYHTAPSAATAGRWRTWAERIYAADPDTRNGIAIELAGVPELRQHGIRLLRERLDVYDSPPDSLRPLHQSVGEFQARINRDVAGLRAALGSALLAAGDGVGGAAELVQSIQERWDPEVAALLLESPAVELPVHEARRLARFLAADPLYGGAAEIAPATAGGSDDVGATRDELQRLLLRDVRTGDVPNARLTSRLGEPVTLDDGRLTVIALWQAAPDRPDEVVLELEDATDRLRASGARVLVATPRQRFAAAAEVADLAGAVPVVDDGSATEGFGGWAAWEYVVVHDGWYSVHYDLEDATRLALLRTGS